MQIYLALWSYGFFDVDEACHVMNKLALDGSRHKDWYLARISGQ